jgi:hypothetical protein
MMPVRKCTISVEVTIAACRLLTSGVHALLALATHVDAAQIVALGRRLRVPTISLTTDDDTYETRGGDGSAHINVHVPARAIGRAVAEIVTNFRWRSFTVLYDHSESMYTQSTHGAQMGVQTCWHYKTC